MQTKTTMNSSSITPSQLKSALDRKTCCLIDVREPVEHAEEHIAEARLIPLGKLERHASEIPAGQPVVVMCRSGRRGEQALAKLKALGFEQVQNLEGGILAWKAEGNAVSAAAKKVFPLMRQVQIIIGAGVLAGVILSRTVHPDFVFLSAFFGAAMVFSGTTGWCGLAILLSKMPWNAVAGQSCRSGSCSTNL